MRVAESFPTIRAQAPTPRASESNKSSDTPTDVVVTGAKPPASDGAQIAKLLITGVGGTLLAVPCAYACLAGGALVGGVLGGALGPVASALSDHGVSSALMTAWHTAGNVGHLGLVMGGASALVGAYSLSLKAGKLFTGEESSHKSINWKNPVTIALGTTLLSAGITSGVVGGMTLAGGAAAIATVGTGLLHSGFSMAALSGLGGNALAFGAAGAITAGAVGFAGAAALTKGFARHVIDPASKFVPEWKAKLAEKIQQQVDQKLTEQAAPKVNAEVARQLPLLVSSRVEEELKGPKAEEIDQKVSAEVARRTPLEVESRASELTAKEVAQRIPSIVSTRVEAELNGPKKAEIDERVQAETAKGLDSAVAKQLETIIRAKTDEKLTQLLPQEVDRRAAEAIAGPRAQEVASGVENKVASVIAARAAEQLEATRLSNLSASKASTYLKAADTSMPAEQQAAFLKAGLAAMSASTSVGGSDRLLASLCEDHADLRYCAGTDKVNPYYVTLYYTAALNCLQESSGDKQASQDPQVYLNWAKKNTSTDQNVRAGFLRTGLRAIYASSETGPEQKGLIKSALDSNLGQSYYQANHFQQILTVLASKTV